MPIHSIRSQTRSMRVAAVLLALLATAPPAWSIADGPRPGPVPAELRKRLGLDSFYQKHLDVDGLPVLGSAKVSDDAMAEAAWIIRRMLADRPDILKAMAGQGVRAVVMAKDEYTTDVPEHAHLRPKLYWDRRARGLGATPRAPAVSGAEENLLSFRGDPYPDENIFLHEFSHAIHGTGLNKVDPTFDGRLKAAYEAALGRGLWKKTYAATNRHEYWAEGVQSWFDDNARPNAVHNDVRTRARLKEYDPGLAALCREVFGDGPWRYVKPRDREPEGRAHLASYDPKNVPRFRWRSTEPGEHPRVVVQTAAGDFDLELDTKSNPVAVKNFLLIALDGGYHSGRFTRAANGGAWATVNPRWKREWAKKLALDRVPTAPAAKPSDGDVVLVREGDDWFGFAIFLGDRPDVGKAEVIPIGRVTAGREVIRKILDSPANDGAPTSMVEIRRVIRNQ
jgi:hypothetical protein